MSFIVKVGLFEEASVNEDIVLFSTFKQQSVNKGVLSGSCVFKDTTVNEGSAIGINVFIDESSNGLTGQVQGSTIFGENAINYGTVRTAVFKDNAINRGVVTLSAIFAGSSRNEGTVEDGAIFVQNSKNIGKLKGFVRSTPTNIEARILGDLSEATLKLYAQPDGAYSYGFYAGEQLVYPTTPTPNTVYNSVDVPGVWVKYNPLTLESTFAQNVGLNINTLQLKYYDAGVQFNDINVFEASTYVYYKGQLNQNITEVFQDPYLNELAANGTGIYKQYDQSNDYRWTINNGFLSVTMLTAYPYKKGEYFTDQNEVVSGVSKLYYSQGTGALIVPNLSSYIDFNLDGSVEEFVTDQFGTVFIVNKNGYYSTGYYRSNVKSRIDDIYARLAIDDNLFYVYDLSGNSTIANGIQLSSGTSSDRYIYFESGIPIREANGLYYTNTRVLTGNVYFVDGGFVSKAKVGSYALSGNPNNYHVFNAEGNDIGISNGIWPLNGDVQNYREFTAGSITAVISSINLNGTNFYFKNQLINNASILYYDPLLQTVATNQENEFDIDNDGLKDVWKTDGAGVYKSSVVNSRIQLNNRWLYYTGNLESGTTVLFKDGLLVNQAGSDSGLKDFNNDGILDQWTINSNGVLTWQLVTEEFILGDKIYYHTKTLTPGVTRLFRDPNLTILAPDLSRFRQGLYFHSITNGLYSTEPILYNEILLGSTTYNFLGELQSGKTQIFDSNGLIESSLFIKGTKNLSGIDVYYTTDNRSIISWKPIKTIILNGVNYYYIGEIEQNNTRLFLDNQLISAAELLKGTGYDFNGNGITDSYSTDANGYLSWTLTPADTSPITLVYSTSPGQFSKQIYYYFNPLSQGVQLFEDAEATKKTTVQLLTGISNIIDVIDESDKDLWTITNGVLTWIPLTAAENITSAANKIFLSSKTYFYSGKLRQNTYLFLDDTAITPAPSGSGSDDIFGGGDLLPWSINEQGQLQWSDTPAGKVTLFGKTDRLPGAVIVDNKTYFYDDKLSSSGTFVYEDVNRTKTTADVKAGLGTVTGIKNNAQFFINESELKWDVIPGGPVINRYFDIISFFSFTYNPFDITNAVYGTAFIEFDEGLYSSAWLNDYFASVGGGSGGGGGGGGAQQSNKIPAANSPAAANPLKYKSVADLDGDGINELFSIKCQTWPPQPRKATDPIPPKPQNLCSINFEKIMPLTFTGYSRQPTRNIKWVYNKKTGIGTSEEVISWRGSGASKIGKALFLPTEVSYLPKTFFETQKPYLRIPLYQEISKDATKTNLDLSTIWNNTIVKQMWGQIKFPSISQSKTANYVITQTNNQTYIDIEHERIYFWNGAYFKSFLLPNQLYSDSGCTIPLTRKVSYGKKGFAEYSNFKNAKFRSNISYNHAWFRDNLKYLTSQDTYCNLEHFPVGAKKDSNGNIQYLYEKSLRESVVTADGFLRFRRPLSFIENGKICYIAGDLVPGAYVATENVNITSHLTTSNPATNIDFDTKETYNTIGRFFNRFLSSDQTKTEIPNGTIQTSSPEKLFFQIFYVNLIVISPQPPTRQSYRPLVATNETRYLFTNVPVVVEGMFTSGQSRAYVLNETRTFQDIWNFLGITPNISTFIVGEYDFDCNGIDSFFVVDENGILYTEYQELIYQNSDLLTTLYTTTIKYKVQDNRLYFLPLTELNSIQLYLTSTTSSRAKNTIGIVTAYFYGELVPKETVLYYSPETLTTMKDHFGNVNLVGTIIGDSKDNLISIDDFSRLNYLELEKLAEPPIEILCGEDPKLIDCGNYDFVYFEPMQKCMPVYFFDDQGNAYSMNGYKGFADVDNNGVVDFFEIIDGQLCWEEIVTVVCSDPPQPPNRPPFRREVQPPVYTYETSVTVVHDRKECMPSKTLDNLIISKKRRVPDVEWPEPKRDGHGNDYFILPRLTTMYWYVSGGDPEKTYDWTDPSRWYYTTAWIDDPNIAPFPANCVPTLSDVAVIKGIIPPTLNISSTFWSMPSSIEFIGTAKLILSGEDPGEYNQPKHVIFPLRHNSSKNSIIQAPNTEDYYTWDVIYR